MNKKLINYQLLKNNLRKFSSKNICVMVKANAYGLGIKNIVEFLKDEVAFFGVSNIFEAREVRKYCENNILIVSKIDDLEECKKENFHFIVDDFKQIEEAKKMDILDLVHIKINTGMNRFGFDPIPCVLQRLKLILKDSQIGGICTHFQDLNDKSLTKKQYKKFIKIKKFLGQNCLVHFGGSDVINYNFDYDMIRVGIGLYAPGESVMKISSNIIEIREVSTGSIGYNQKYEVRGLKKIGLVPIGYADGLLRVFSGSYVDINGCRCKIIGNICMDLCFIDLTNVDATIGDEVIFLKDISEVCRITNLTRYEVLTGFSKLRER